MRTCLLEAEPEARKETVRPTALDFFAGSGLVSQALKPFFDIIWANDVCPRKAAVYTANHPSEHFKPGPIEEIFGSELPQADLSWASFPCQDLSLAGNTGGIHSSRSGLVWQWLRLLDESPTRPPLLVAENVVGLLSVDGGQHYRRLHRDLAKRGYRVGPVVLDAVHWLPQSRPRVFVVAVDKSIPTSDLEARSAAWCHPSAVAKVRAGLPSWAWWRLPPPSLVPPRLEEVIEFDAPVDDEARRQHNLGLIPHRHLEKLQARIAANQRVFPGYKRTRNGTQVLELRFDGIAGCLRTPEGGSSRQLLVLAYGDRLETRLWTVKETSRLMGAHDDYRIPGTYNDGYRAMGDAVAIPVAEHLARHLLLPLAKRALA